MREHFETRTNRGVSVAGRNAHFTFAVAALAVVFLSMAATYDTVRATTASMDLLSSTAIVFLFAGSWLFLWLATELSWAVTATRRRA